MPFFLPATAFSYAPPVPWANGFSGAGQLPLVADLNGDGDADLLTVSLSGGFFDVAMNGNGQKCQVPQRARSDFGRDLVAAAAGNQMVFGLQKDGSLRIATHFHEGVFDEVEDGPRYPASLTPAPEMAFVNGSVVVWPGAGPKGFSLDPASRKWSPYEGAHPSFEHPLGTRGSIWRAGDVDGDGDLDAIEFRHDSNMHDGNNVLVYRQISSGETDSDHDGIANEEEAAIGTDPLNPDTDNDGLLDGWEVGSFRGLDFKGMGCDPRHADVICLISRFQEVDEPFCRDMLGRAQAYYGQIKSPNPDGRTGWNLHLIYRNVLNGEEQKKGWPEQRDAQIPAAWKGIVHWMQISPNGGGQADQLGDGGGCGGGGWALYATFVHEFGHQLGLSHEGFYPAAWCPTYPSLMNYAYSYTLEGDIKNVRYSDGRLVDFTMNERDLSEVLPLPYEKVKFLEQAPYHYRLKPDGDKTLIDWNWNGVFGEQHIRADINYSYSTTAGRRDDVARLHSAPSLVVDQGRAYVLYARHDFPIDIKTDPTVSPEKPGSLYLRKLIKPYAWEPEVKVTGPEVVGDPVSVSCRNDVWVAYPSPEGVTVRTLKGRVIRLPESKGLLPSLGTLQGRLLIMLWDPATGRSHYAWWTGDGFGDRRLLNILSRVPVGLAEDTIQHRLIVGLNQDQDAGRPGRWQIRRYSLSGDTLFERSKEWIEGEAGGARGSSRPTILFDPDPANGPQGRVYYFAQGTVSKAAPWSCEYVAETIGDPTVHGGWQVKRFYDEWTQSRSAPAAAWFDGDIIYAYRWVNGAQNDNDNLLHVAYRGSGIEDATMGDFDDIGFIRSFGMRYSILYVADGGG